MAVDHENARCGSAGARHAAARYAQEQKSARNVHRRSRSAGARVLCAVRTLSDSHTPAAGDRRGEETRSALRAAAAQNAAGVRGGGGDGEMRRDFRTRGGTALRHVAFNVQGADERVKSACGRPGFIPQVKNSLKL